MKIEFAEIRRIFSDESLDVKLEGKSPKAEMLWQVTHCHLVILAVRVFSFLPFAKLTKEVVYSLLSNAAAKICYHEFISLIDLSTFLNLLLAFELTSVIPP